MKYKRSKSCEKIIKIIFFSLIIILIYFAWKAKHYLGIDLQKNGANAAREDLVDMYTLKQDDPVLVREIRRRFLIPPPPPGTPYVLNLPINEEPSQGQSVFVKDIYHGKRDLFFVECGANDGEFKSNTLILERRFGWRGLLIEPDLLEVAKLKDKQRQSWIAPVALCTDTSPSVVRFESRDNGQGIVLEANAPKKPTEHNVQCLPFYSIMLAMNRTTIDYFSLDVGPAIWPILKSIPFELLNIRVMSVDYSTMKPKEDETVKFMEEKGFRMHSKMKIEHWAEDFIFVNKDFKLS